MQSTALELFPDYIVEALLPIGVKRGPDAPDVGVAEEVVETLLLLLLVTFETVVRLQQDLEEVAHGGNSLDLDGLDKLYQLEQPDLFKSWLDC